MAYCLLGNILSINTINIQSGIEILKQKKQKSKHNVVYNVIKVCYLPKFCLLDIVELFAGHVYIFNS